MREEVVMEEQTVIHSTFVIERSFAKSPEIVFAAFADPAKKRRWFADGGEKHDVEQFEMDFRVGGGERQRYRFKEGSPFPGVALSNEVTYLDIVPDRRIVSAYTMSLGDRHISSSLVTIELLATGDGANRRTDLIFTHQGAYFEGSGGAEMREAGWRSLFDKLAAEMAK